MYIATRPGNFYFFTSRLGKFLCFIVLWLYSIQAKATDKPHLSIYLKTNECTNCYLPVRTINSISSRVKIEIVHEPEEEEYARDLLNSYQVLPLGYTMRNARPDENYFFSHKQSALVFRSTGTILYGNLLLLEYLNGRLDSILQVKPVQPNILIRQPGLVGFFPPMYYADHKLKLYDERLRKFYIDSAENGVSFGHRDYFISDSLRDVYKIEADTWRNIYLDLLKDPTHKAETIQGMFGWRNETWLTGELNFAITPLYRNKENYFLHKLEPPIVATSSYMFIRKSPRYSLDMYSGINLADSPGISRPNKFYGLVWQNKKKADSFLAAEYRFDGHDNRWVMARVFCLDTTKNGFDYSENLQNLSGQYALHANLPNLYSFPEVRKNDLSPVLSYVFQREIKPDAPMPEKHNITQLWSGAGIVKFFCSEGKKIFVVTYLTGHGVCQVQPVNMEKLITLKNLRNVGFDEKGNPLVLFNSGKTHTLFIVN